MGNEPSDEIINQENENPEEIFNFFPPSLKEKNINNNSFNQYEGNEYNLNPNYDENKNNNNIKVKFLSFIIMNI